MRNIDDILHFREDISPFLAHLTRASDTSTARSVLEAILDEEKLRPGECLVSDARFGMNTNELEDEEKRRLFGAICFTETPLNEVHCLLEISYRSVDLEPYGIVFLKDRLLDKQVSPVCYINNSSGHRDDIFYAVCSLYHHAGWNLTSYLLLPLFSVFGQKIRPPGAYEKPEGEVDFRWEREWRRPYVHAAMDFSSDDIFVGLCPHDEISHFKNLYPTIDFIDPTRNMKWYSTALVAARQRLDVKFSVV